MSNINQLQLNENAVRFTAGFVVVLTVVVLFTGWITIPVFLSIDFFLRAFTHQKSPLALVSIYANEKLKIQPKLIYAPPKKFAAAVGFVFSVAITILLLLKLQFVASMVGSVLLFCAALESFLGICIGCYVYDWFVAPFVNKEILKH